MKKLSIYILSGTLLWYSGCTNDFEEINTNPNAPEAVSPNLLLSTVISVTSREMADFSFRRGLIVAQLSAQSIFTDFDRYNWTSENTHWNILYGALTEVELILEFSRNPETSNTSYEAMALILKSWIYSNITDSWGDVPYSQAIKGQSEGIFAPVYDEQSAIYAGILADLATADGLLAQGQTIAGGDLIYDGDLNKWRKLANSLRLRYLLRTSNRNGGTGMQQIVDNSLIFEDNRDNAIMDFEAGSRATWFPTAARRIGSFNQTVLSETIFDKLELFNDNRLAIWFLPTDNPDDDPAFFSGQASGLSENNASTYKGGTLNVSRANEVLMFDNPVGIQAMLMKYDELQFVLAEAAQRGFITGDAQTYYENGVTASHEYWNSGQDVTSYLAQAGVAYDGTMLTIMTQKWLASFLVGLEAWYDIRRIGQPSFVLPSTENVNGDKIPVRFLYPDDEQALNADNYATAVAKMSDGDDINSAGWWEQ